MKYTPSQINCILYSVSFYLATPYAKLKLISDLLIHFASTGAPFLIIENHYVKSQKHSLNIIFLPFPSLFPFFFVLLQMQQLRFCMMMFQTFVDAWLFWSE